MVVFRSKMRCFIWNKSVKNLKNAFFCKKIFFYRKKFRLYMISSKFWKNPWKFKKFWKKPRINLLCFFIFKNAPRTSPRIFSLFNLKNQFMPKIFSEKRMLCEVVGRSIKTANIVQKVFPQNSNWVPKPSKNLTKKLWIKAFENFFKIF